MHYTHHCAVMKIHEVVTNMKSPLDFWVSARFIAINDLIPLFFFAVYLLQYTEKVSVLRVTTMMKHIKMYIHDPVESCEEWEACLRLYGKGNSSTVLIHKWAEITVCTELCTSHCIPWQWKSILGNRDRREACPQSWASVQSVGTVSREEDAVDREWGSPSVNVPC